MMKRLSIAALLVLFAAHPLRAEILEQILVKVNGEIFTKTDLEQRQVTYLRQQKNQQYSEEDLKNDETLQKALADITPTIIVDAVDELLLLQRGKELGYRLTDERFKEVIENIKKENKIESDEQFQAALKQEGMSMDDLRKSLEKQMLMARVQQAEIFGKVSVTEDEERAYFAAHADEFTTPSSVTLREILIESHAETDKGTNATLEQQAKTKADAVRARLAAGEDFAKVAAEISDAPSKANGGLIGPVTRSELAPTLQAALDKLSVGQVSEVLRSSRGFQILKLESATSSTVASFESARSQIADKVFATKRQAEFQRYLLKLRTSAIIEWKNDELKKLYEQRVATQMAPTPSEQ